MKNENFAKFTEVLKSFQGKLEDGDFLSIIKERDSFKYEIEISKSEIGISVGLCVYRLSPENNLFLAYDRDEMCEYHKTSLLIDAEKYLTVLKMKLDEIILVRQPMDELFDKYLNI